MATASFPASSVDWADQPAVQPKTDTSHRIKEDPKGGITYVWPEGMAEGFGREIFLSNHNGHQSPHFTDEALARLLDEYPRDKLGVYKFPDHAEGKVKAIHGSAPDLSGAEILEAVKKGELWLNLRAVNRELETYSELANSLFDQLEAASGVKTLKRDMGVLISSPNIHVHYHLDIPLVCLVQVRGVKTLYLYPVGAPFAEPEQLEDIVLRTQDEELRYLNEFEEHVRVIELKPGMALTWPQTAPHRVQNADVLNVSLSCEYMTMPGLLKANALYANGKLRRTVGYKADFPQTVGPITFAKAVAAQALKKVQPVPEKSPTPITFELKPGGEIETFEAAVVSVDAPEAIIKRMDELTDAEIAAWRTLCEGEASFSGALQSPDFAKMISEIRDDVRVILVSRGDKLVAVLAVHERSFGLVRPVGSPFCDTSGPVIAEGETLTLGDILELSGYAGYRSLTSLRPAGAGGRTSEAEDTYAIQLNGLSPEAYLEVHRAQHPKRFKNFRRLMSKLTRDRGEIEFFAGAPKSDDVAQLLAWKRRQFEDDGLLDITSAGYSAAILEAATTSLYDEVKGFGGYMTGLRVGGQLIVGHFGVRYGSDFHPWISAFDPELGDYSPGGLLLYRAIEMMTEMGLESYDLASGHDFYKKYFADVAEPIYEVEVYRPGLMGGLQKFGYRAWDYLGAKNPSSIVARVRRRLEHAVVSEPSLVGRARDLMMAIMKRGSARQRGHASPEE